MENELLKEITAQEVEEKKMSWHELMKKYKPDITESEADYILWNETNYPFDNATTVKQLYELFKNMKQTV